MVVPIFVVYICFWSTKSIEAQKYPLQVGSKVEKLLQSNQPVQEIRVGLSPQGGNGVVVQSSAPAGANNEPLNVLDIIPVDAPGSPSFAGLDAVLQNNVNGGGPQTVMINGGSIPSEQWLSAAMQNGGNGLSNGPVIADIWNINEPSGNAVAGEVPPPFNAQPGATTVNVGHGHGFNGVSVHPDIPYTPPSGEQFIYPEGTIYDIYSRNIGPVNPHDAFNFGNQNMIDPNSIPALPAQENLPIENNHWGNFIGGQNMVDQSWQQSPDTLNVRNMVDQNWQHTPDTLNVQNMVDQNWQQTPDTLNVQNMVDPTQINSAGVELIPGTGGQPNQFWGVPDMTGAPASGQEIQQAGSGGQGVWNIDWQAVDVPVIDNRISPINVGSSGQNAAGQEPLVSAGMEQRIRRQMERGLGISNELSNWELSLINSRNSNGGSRANNQDQNQSGQGRTNGGGAGNGGLTGQRNIGSGRSISRTSVLPSNLNNAIIIVVPANNMPGELKSSAARALRDACQGNSCSGSANNGLDQVINQELNRISGNTIDPNSSRSGIHNGGRRSKGATYRNRTRKYGSYRKPKTYGGLKLKYGRKVYSYRKPQTKYGRKRTYSKKYRKGGY